MTVELTKAELKRLIDQNQSSINKQLLSIRRLDADNEFKTDPGYHRTRNALQSTLNKIMEIHSKLEAAYLEAIEGGC